MPRVTHKESMLQGGVCTAGGQAVSGTAGHLRLDPQANIALNFWRRPSRKVLCTWIGTALHPRGSPIDRGVSFRATTPHTHWFDYLLAKCRGIEKVCPPFLPKEH